MRWLILFLLILGGCQETTKTDVYDKLRTELINKGIGYTDSNGVFRIKDGRRVSADFYSHGGSK